jgi:hypothetical protein
MTSLQDFAEVVIGSTPTCTATARGGRCPHRRRAGRADGASHPGRLPVLWRISPVSRPGCGPGPSRGTGGHCVGLSRMLAGRSELVVDLDRPRRTKRRNGAKSDPLDAIRAAREALSRAKLGTPARPGTLSVLPVPGWVYEGIASGGTMSVNRAQSQGQGLAGIKGYITNLAACPDGTPVTAEFVNGAYHRLFQIENHSGRPTATCWPARSTTGPATRSEPTSRSCLPP